MIRSLRIQDTLENKISYFHLAAFLVMLPYDRFYTQLILVSALLHTLIHANSNRVSRLFTWQNALLTGIFFLFLAGTLWSNDKSQAIKDVQRQLGLLLFPVVFSLTGINLRRYKWNLLTLFSTGICLTILYLYINAFYILLYHQLPLDTIISPAFMNHYFSLPIDIHATYLSLYAALSAIVFLHLVLIEKVKQKRAVYIAALFLLAAGLLQLASRAVWISLLCYLIFLFPFFLANRRTRRLYYLSAAAFSLTFILAILCIHPLRERYVDQLRNDLVYSSNDVLEPRTMRWQYAGSLFLENPWIGHGSGSEKRLLQESYFQHRLYFSYLHELNAHNQYLSFLLKTGVMGFFLYLFTLFWAFRIAIQEKDTIFAGFLVLIATVSLSENILDVNKGVFFYAFFFSLFITAGKPFYSKSRLVG